jgi:ubiquinone/menaquinone biosynthesis C-methylase UbiE
MSAPNTQSDYVLGQTSHEYERLMLQAKLLRLYTERYFRSAGVTQGMRVLDVGAGMGDVALLAGDIVGPAGLVVGIDRDATALTHATRRAAEQGCSSWVTFEATTLDAFAGPGMFDALVGRYVLMYQPDAAATMRQLLRFVKPGGLVVFQELDFPDPSPSNPPCRIFDEVYALLGAAFQKSGADPHFGRKIATAFTGAGMPFPTIMCDGLIGGGRGSYSYRWLANTVISVASRLEALGLALPDGVVADDTLHARIEAAVTTAGSQVMMPTQYGAWTRKPWSQAEGSM